MKYDGAASCMDRLGRRVRAQVVVVASATVTPIDAVANIANVSLGLRTRLPAQHPSQSPRLRPRETAAEVAQQHALSLHLQSQHHPRHRNQREETPPQPQRLAASAAPATMTGREIDSGPLQHRVAAVVQRE